MENIHGATEGSSPAAPPQKFSRYRSVRAAKAAAEPTPPPPLPVEEPIDVKRGPSRYRRNRSGTNAETPASLPPPAPQGAPNLSGGRGLVERPQGPKQPIPRPDPVPQEERRRVRDRANTTGTHAKPQPSGYPNRSESRTNTTTPDSIRPPTAARSYDAAREEARMILEGEFDRLQKLKKLQAQQRQNAGSNAPDMRRRPATAKEVRVPREVANSGQDVRQTPPRKPKEPRAPEPAVEEQPEQKSPPVKKIRQLITGGRRDGSPQQQLQDEKLPHSRKPSRAAGPGLASSVSPPVAPAVPPSEPARAFDAPISAVNAGDRRVEVKCNQASITLPVTPSTTVKDLLNSASVVMSETIDPKTAVLLEAFSYLGLERPLRRYERIRDVMNSWATDTQHHLFIMTESECAAPGLEVKDAPTVQPLDTQVQMYLSSRPGKWDKRWIKLREDGQVTVSKSESGLESTNICHLSDFDLYTPTSKQKKQLRNPKKICFGVKSQQKAAMFLEGQNFAHFFCSNRKEDADRWYNALHSWRSWYLVNILGEGQKPPEPRGLSIDVERRPSTARSRDTVPYQLGSFKPLLDFSDLNFGADDEPRGVEISGRRSMDIHSGSPKRMPRNQGCPPPSFPKRLVLDVVEQEDQENQPFTGTGLLARSPSRRMQGGHGSGRGVPGVKGKPLVDLSASSEFAEGSLLRKLEAWTVHQDEAEP